MTTTTKSKDKKLVKVPIFAPGHLTNSRGQEKDFTDADIKAIIDAFSQGVPPSIPIKIGHSTDEFNNKVATELELPISVIQGEGDTGTGAIQLGEITELALNAEGDLIADMTVHEGVAKMVTDGFFTGLSSELQFDRKQDDKIFPTVLSGVAFLGAQRPALSDLPSLQEATMLSDGTYADAVFFTDVVMDAEYMKGDDESYFESGSTMLSPDKVSSGGKNERPWTVPVRDLTRGRQVYTTVSAPNEVEAKRTALRVVEHFLLSITGPLGTAIGVAGGAVIASRLVVGKPVLGGIKGLVKWKFEDPFDLEVETLELNEILTRITGLLGRNPIGINLAEGKEGTMPEDDKGTDLKMRACMAKAKADGVEDPAAYCKAKFGEEASVTLNELAKAMDLSEWDGEGILVKVQGLLASESNGSKFEEETTSQIRDLTSKLLISEYSEKVESLELVSGTRQAKAEQLAKIETLAGAETATLLLESWEAQQKAAEAAKITETVLHTGSELAPSEFSEALVKYKTDNPSASESDALKATMRSNPSLAASRNGRS